MANNQDRQIKATQDLYLETETSSSNIYLNPATSGIVSVGKNLNMNSNSIISCADPSNAQDVATKAYVDSQVSGLSQEATTATAPLSMNGTAVELSYSNPLYNNSGSLDIRLDSGNLEVNGSNELGIKASGVGSTEIADNAITASKINSSALYSSGGLGKSVVDGSLLVNIDDSTIEVNVSNNLQVKDAGITSAKLASGLSLSGVVSVASGNSNANSKLSSHYLETSNATPATLASLAIADDECELVEVWVCARDQTTGDKAGYKASFVCSAASGTAVLDSSANVEVVHEDDATWNLSVSASSGNILVQATGDDTNSCHWCAYVKRVRCA
jgi:hypothetical protein